MKDSDLDQWNEESVKSLSEFEKAYIELLERFPLVRVRADRDGALAAVVYVYPSEKVGRSCVLLPCQAKVS
jgi:gamma-glutamylcyclotransferase (GGCT)/AIG2-like uncharacterized protein YtfP